MRETRCHFLELFRYLTKKKKQHLRQFMPPLKTNTNIISNCTLHNHFCCKAGPASYFQHFCTLVLKCLKTSAWQIIYNCIWTIFLNNLWVFTPIILYNLQPNIAFCFQKQLKRNANSHKNPLYNELNIWIEREAPPVEHI